MRRLAFGNIQDAVALLFESEENILNTLPELDLFNVSEIKRPKNGGMEIKFFDRLKAFEKLREMVTPAGNGNSPASFYEALERSAVNTNESCEDSVDE